MKQGLLIAATLALAFAGAPGLAREPVPRTDIIDTIRELAADQLGVKKSDVSLVNSLAAQGMTEAGLSELVVAISQEFNVAISDRALFEAKQQEPVRALSVIRLADLVEDEMHPAFPDQ